MNNVRRIPFILMLSAGAITGIIAYIRDFSLINFLWVLIAALVVFYIIGAVAAKTILRFEKANKEAEEEAKAKEKEEGAVIEKEAVPEDIQNTPENEMNTSGGSRYGRGFRDGRSLIGGIVRR